MGNWSSSRVSTYKDCPLKYYYSYVRPFKSDVPVNTVLADKGSCLHETVEKYHTGMSRDELLEILSEKCQRWNIINDTEENKEKYSESERERVFDEKAGKNRF